MYHIQEVKIVELWGHRNVQLRFNAGVNFLVGRNGSGKTAVIQLIAAALAGNVDKLTHLNFKSISIMLLNEKKQTTQLLVEQSPASNEFPGRKVTLRFGDWIDSEPSFGRLYIGARPISPLVHELVSQVKLTWLDVNRQRLDNPTGREQKPRPIDETLAGVETNLTKYFSDVRTRVDDEMQEFIKFVFTNLIPIFPSETSKTKSTTPLNPSKDRETLNHIFTTFGIGDRAVKKRLDDFTERVSRVQTQLSNTKERPKAIEELSADINNFLSISYSLTTHRVVERWLQFTSKRSEITDLQDRFIETVNQSFRGKHLEINSRNEPVFMLEEPSRNLAMSELSSGEKQLFIILSEALLQGRVRSIYLADEPELSLHIQWQEILVSSIREINPNAQIIFATHSPDIIGKNRNHVTDMTVDGDAT